MQELCRALAEQKYRGKNQYRENVKDFEVYIVTSFI